jgi:predicted RND superfamily exporter protein
MRRLRDVLGRFLERAAGAKDPAPLLAELEKLLLGGLPAQLARLRLALHSGPVTLANLPPELSLRMLAPDGRARVQAFSASDLADSDELYRFADAIRGVDTDITGLIANILAFGRATVQSLRQALTSAVVAMALLLWLLWRRWRDVALVLAILALGALYTGAAMVLLGMPYNFSNVVVLPLLLGVGVDSAIHLVHRWRSGERGDDGLLSTTTARAVFYSALTTVTSFGTLALSAHRGVASLGVLLVLGMAMMLFCNLIVLPAFLAVAGRARS